MNSWFPPILPAKGKLFSFRERESMSGDDAGRGRELDSGRDGMELFPFSWSMVGDFGGELTKG